MVSDPTSASAYCRRALARIRQGMPQKALEDYDEATGASKGGELWRPFWVDNFSERKIAKG